MSKDHKPTDEEEEKRITGAGSKVTNGRINGALNVSRAIGDLDYKRTKKRNRVLQINETPVIAEPDVVKIEREGIELIILGTDGIW